MRSNGFAADLNYRIRRFGEVEPEVWDGWARSLDDATYLHSAAWLGYCHTLIDRVNCYSFAILDQNDAVVALCPLGISRVEAAGAAICETSWHGVPVGAPAIRRGWPPARRKLVRNVYAILNDNLIESGVDRSVFWRYPVSMATLKGDSAPTGALDAVSAGYILCHARNRIIVDLKLSEQDLRAGLTHTMRNTLRQSQKRGLLVRAFRGNDAGLDEAHRLYQETHFRSAGRLTRPQESFDYMLGAAKREQFTLFIAYLDNEPVSFLYCAEFGGLAITVSQVNVEEREDELSPRHLLEWTAILSYQQRGFAFYEIGVRWYGPQPYESPSPKELSIAFFNERYGGGLWPDLIFERFFDPAQFHSAYAGRLSRLLNSGYFGEPQPGESAGIGRQ